MKITPKTLIINTALGSLNMLQVGNEVHMTTQDMDRIIATPLDIQCIIMLKQFFNQLEINDTL